LFNHIYTDYLHR